MSDTITLPRELVVQAVRVLSPMAYDTWPRERNEVVEALRTALAAKQPQPSGYAYRYADGVLRLNDGSQFNGGWPVEAVPYWFAPPAAAPSEDIDALRLNDARYRWLREKDGIAVDVTVFGSMEANLDAAIDAAMKEGT